MNTPFRTTPPARPMLRACATCVTLLGLAALLDFLITAGLSAPH